MRESLNVDGVVVITNFLPNMNYLRPLGNHEEPLPALNWSKQRTKRQSRRVNSKHDCSQSNISYNFEIRGVGQSIRTALVRNARLASNGVTWPNPLRVLPMEELPRRLYLKGDINFEMDPSFEIASSVHF